MESAKSSGREEQHGAELCARCRGPMVETHCKVMCVNCGYMRDCNDQW